MTEKLNWNLPLVSDFGKISYVSGPDTHGFYSVIFADGNSSINNSAGRAFYSDSFLRNRPWQVGDPVVSVSSAVRGVVEDVNSHQGDAFHIFVRFGDDPMPLWVSVYGIRYDYSRARTEPDIEALIADVLETHEAVVRDRELVDCVEISLRNWSDSAFPDSDIGLAARSIIALVREHDKREAV